MIEKKKEIFKFRRLLLIFFVGVFEEIFRARKCDGTKTYANEHVRERTRYSSTIVLSFRLYLFVLAMFCENIIAD